MADSDYHIISKPDSLESGFFIYPPGESITIGYPTKFDPHDFCSKEEWIKIENRAIITSRGKTLLTMREGKLLHDFLLQDNLFLHNKEIRESLAIKNEKSLISRLRIKLRGVTGSNPGLSIKIIPVKGQGYYLEIIVDNLWKTQ